MKQRSEDMSEIIFLQPIVCKGREAERSFKQSSMHIRLMCIKEERMRS
jgi:hypothetical protein